MASLIGFWIAAMLENENYEVNLRSRHHPEQRAHLRQKAVRGRQPVHGARKVGRRLDAVTVDSSLRVEADLGWVLYHLAGGYLHQSRPGRLAFHGV